MTETENKHCLNCKFLEYDCSLPPCADCNLHKNWEPRNES